MSDVTKTVGEASGALENAILLALDAKTSCARRERSTADGYHKTTSSSFVKEQAIPSHSYLVGDWQDRVMSLNVNSLLQSAWHTIGDRLEFTAAFDNWIKWSAIIPMKQKPRGVAAITNQPIRWYGLHFRHVFEDGSQKYVKNPIALQENGTCCRLRFMGWDGCDAHKAQQEAQFVTMMGLNIAEDVARPTAIKATLTEGDVSLTFAVSLATYLSFFRDRDGWRDTPTRRRNPLVHWVATHLRQTPNSATEVRGHGRGRHEVHVGGMTLVLSAPRQADGG